MSDNTNLASLSDEALMLAYADNNAAAFELLYGRHRDAVYRFFLRHQQQQQDSTVAEELCHDCWLKVINSRSRYEVSAKFTTWLYTIARHTAFDYYQRKHLQLIDHGLDTVNEENGTYEYDSGSAKSSETVYKQAQLSNALTKAIADLPLEQRQVFLLKQEAGFNLEEIGYITAQNKEKIKSSWRYAIQKLRKGLSDYV